MAAAGAGRGAGRARRARRGGGRCSTAPTTCRRRRVPHVYMNLWVLRRARRCCGIAQGRFDEAVDELRECGRRALDIDHVNPARAGVALAARARADGSSASSDEAERAGRGGARARAALRRRGARSGSRCWRWREVDRASVAPLREAVAVLDGSAAVLETRPRALRARRRAARGAASVDDAREALRRAVDLAHRCGGQRGRGRGAGRAARDRRAPAAAADDRRGRADAERAPDRRARRGRPAEPRDRRGAVRDHGDGRVPPAQRLPQARDQLAHAAGRVALTTKPFRRSSEDSVRCHTGLSTVLHAAIGGGQKSGQ